MRACRCALCNRRGGCSGNGGGGGGDRPRIPATTGWGLAFFLQPLIVDDDVALFFGASNFTIVDDNKTTTASDRMGMLARRVLRWPACTFCLQPPRRGKNGRVRASNTSKERRGCRPKYFRQNSWEYETPWSVKLSGVSPKECKTSKEYHTPENFKISGV
jgi:hypothetical protein